jgi:hypothetical protein
MIRMNAFAVVAVLTASAMGQTRFDTFSNEVSDCSIVNGATNEFVVLTEQFPRLMRITGSDLILDDTFVDANSFVFFQGEQLGLIDFAIDGDGRDTLWWITFDGFVVGLDGLTGEPVVTDATPSEFFDVPCDACEFVDRPAIGECTSEPRVVLCGNGVTPAMLMTMGVGLLGLRLTRFD